MVQQKNYSFNTLNAVIKRQFHAPFITNRILCHHKYYIRVKCSILRYRKLGWLLSIKKLSQWILYPLKTYKIDKDKFFRNVIIKRSILLKNVFINSCHNRLLKICLHWKKSLQQKLDSFWRLSLCLHFLFMENVSMTVYKLNLQRCINFFVVKKRFTILSFVKPIALFLL